MLVFVVLRNLWPAVRGQYLALLQDVGKITLELYLLQVRGVAVVDRRGSCGGGGGHDGGDLALSVAVTALLFLRL